MTTPAPNTGTEAATFALTTPLYYVNGRPHIGSAYTTMAADALARFYRLRGRSVLSITGTDEHGQKIERTAQGREMEPQAHCDEMVDEFNRLWERLNIKYDRFSRTTNDRHHGIVKEFFRRVWDKGDIYLGEQQGWYCVACEEFKEERDLNEEKYCATHTNQKAEWRDESNYFFRLSKYQEKLEKLYATNPDMIQPESRRNEVLSFMKQGLQDFSVSRVNLAWGFPFPTDPDHTIYVWFDALLGYVTALLDPDDEPTLDNALKRWWPINLHIIGKDISRFHALYWPAMLMSAGLEVTQKLFIHGFLTKDGLKMGKSTGNALDAFELTERYQSDGVRYYFLKEIEFGRDGDFNETRFVNVLNADLANDLGNLLNRTLRMAHKYCDGKVPEVVVPDSDGLRSRGEELETQVVNAYEKVAFHQACGAVLGLAQAGNKYLDERAPWTSYKEEERAVVEENLYAVLEAVRLAAYWLSPVTPTLSEAIYKQLGYDVSFSNLKEEGAIALNNHGQWGILSAGQIMEKPQPVFQKIDLA